MRFAVLLLLAVAAEAADSVPQWVLEAAKVPVREYGPKVSSVVLLREERLTVEPNGDRTATERGAVRILRESRNGVSAFRAYNTKSGRIRQFNGWLVSPDGKAVAMKKELVTDRALSQQYTYDEARARILECSPSTPPGSVFAWEIVEEERTVFTHYRFDFQDELPVLSSSFVLTLPQGWEVRSRMAGHAEVAPAIAQNTWRWTLQDLPAIEAEEYAPGSHVLEPRLWVAWLPPTENRAGLRSLASWGAVSAWLSELADPSSQVTPAVAARAADLTRGAATELEKIRRIAAFVQQTNYVSVQMNLTRGGGYTPNPADLVMTRNYGDCKDKSALMRALLKAVGIDAYVTTIFSGDRTYVNPDWASPLQFNHAIVAIRVSGETVLPTVIEDSQLGRLLIFDPTAEWTPPGDLPRDQQGSHALVLAGNQGKLLRMPLLPAEANRVETTVTAGLDGEGSARGTLARSYFGDSASVMRSLHRSSDTAVRKVFENSLSHRLGGSTVTDVAATDVAAEGRFEAKVQFTSARFAQTMQNRLLVVRPGLLTGSNDYYLPAGERKNPVRLRSRERMDTVEVKLPEGFGPDEVPEKVAFDSPWGKYTAEWAVENGLLRMKQKLSLTDVNAPAEQYTAVREFLERVSGAQHSAVVLVKNR